MGLGSIGGQIGGSILGSSGAKKQLALMRDALDYSKAVDQRTYGDLSPYRDFGKTQLNSLGDFLNTKSASNYIDPGYQFRLNAGTNAINNSAAANGMQLTGDTLRGLTEYGQNMGSQEYNNAFNRFLQEGQFRQGLAGMGQEAATAGGSLGNQAASNIGQIATNTDAGASDRIWGKLVSGMGGLAGQGFAQGGGMDNLSNAFSNIFKSGGGDGGASANWLGVYGA